MKTKIKTRIGSRAESIKCIHSSIPEADQDAMGLPDGNPDACRIIFNRETGEPVLNKDGSMSYCAPWLLSGIFA